MSLTRWAGPSPDLRFAPATLSRKAKARRPRCASSCRNGPPPSSPLGEGGPELVGGRMRGRAHTHLCGQVSAAARNTDNREPSVTATGGPVRRHVQRLRAAYRLGSLSPDDAGAGTRHSRRIRASSICRRPTTSGSATRAGDARRRAARGTRPDAVRPAAGRTRKAGRCSTSVRKDGRSQTASAVSSPPPHSSSSPARNIPRPSIDSR